MRELKDKNTKREAVVIAVVNLIGLLITVCGIIIAIKMLFVPRSLWIDEAGLAYSFSLRSITKLTSQQFEWMQSAPVGFLYVEKLLSLSLGNTEQVLRLYSLLSYFLLLVLMFLSAKNMFKSRVPMLPVGYVSSMSIILQYSNVFKPYMQDAWMVLLVIYLYYCWKEKKIKTIGLAITWSVLIWFSNPVCFAIGGCLLVDLVLFVKKDTSISIKEELFISICIGFSFVIDYFYWLRGAATDADMQGFWKGHYFKLILKSKEDWVHAKELIHIIMQWFNTYEVLFCAVILLMSILAIIKVKKYHMCIVFCIVVSLFASSIHMYPIQERLWVFAYPLIILIVFDFFENVILQTNSSLFLKTSVFFLLIVFIFNNNGIEMYKDDQNVYWKGYETNYQVEYLQDVANASDSIYVYYYAVPGVKYKIGYDTSELNGAKIIYGNTLFGEADTCEEDIEKILENESCYIVTSSFNDVEGKKLIETLKQYGTLELVDYRYDTPLWHYTSNNEKKKTQYSINEIDEYQEGNYMYKTIQIVNTGETYLNHMYEDVYLGGDGLVGVYSIPKMIAPSQSIEIKVYCEPGTDNIHLYTDKGVL